MQCLQNLFSKVKGITLAQIVLISIAFNPQLASAQAAYGSYVGAGVSLGLNDSNGEGRQLGGVIAARYKLQEIPFSVRTQALISGSSSAIVPTVSYDYPINWQTDAYLGAGLVLPVGDRATPVGDKTSFALQPGVDYSLPNSNTVVFGNAIFAFDAYRNGGGTAISVQGGVGVRF
ncbi:MAG TPA: hypothetical protein V6D15_20535 [Oculatellaceae cyanobacterium]|jgi:hypothetical protein